MKMAKDKEYRAAVRSQLELWLSVDCDVLYSLEDLFLLPPGEEDAFSLCLCLSQVFTFIA